MKIERIQLIPKWDERDGSIQNPDRFWDTFGLQVLFQPTLKTDSKTIKEALESFFSVEMSWGQVLKNPSNIDHFFEWLDSAPMNNLLGMGGVHFLKKDANTLLLIWDIEYFGERPDGKAPEISVKDFRKWLNLCRVYAEEVQEFFSKLKSFPKDEELPVYIGS